MVHLRTNLTVRIRRRALASGLPAQLETGAVLVRGSTGKARFHQFTASASPSAPGSSVTDENGDSTTSGTRMLRTAALFPMVGSANPVLTGLTLAARKAAEAIA